MIHPGLKIDCYVIDDELGRGGFGSVYLAHDENTGTSVAIKFLHPKSIQSEEARHSFIDEMINQARLSTNPNIVHVIRSLRLKDRQGEHMGMVMEYVDGDPLDLYIQKYGLLPEYVAIPIFLQVLNGISFAHQHNMLHRDIKPGNIIIGVDGLVKIMDFGLSKVMQASSSGASESARAASLNYVAPERLDRKSIDQRTDIYSLGATFYEAVTGRPPYKIENGDWDDARQKHKSHAFAHIRDFYERHSDELDSVIRRALAPNPEKRYPNCKDIVTDLIPIWKHRTVPSTCRPEFRIVVDITQKIFNGSFNDSIFAGMNKAESPDQVNARRRKEEEAQVRKEAEVNQKREEEGKKIRELEEARRREDIAKREEKLRHFKRQAIAAFDARNYPEALSLAGQFLEMEPKDAEMKRMKKTVDSTISLVNQIEKLRSDASPAKYQLLIPLLEKLHFANPQEIAAKLEKDFLDQAVDFLDGTIFIRTSQKKIKYDDAITAMQRIDPGPFSDYASILRNTLDQLQDDKVEAKRKSQIVEINERIHAALVKDDYPAAMGIIREMNPFIKVESERMYSEQTCAEMLAMKENIMDLVAAHDYRPALGLLGKMRKLNPDSMFVSKKTKEIEKYIKLKEDLDAADDPVTVFKAIGSTRSEIGDLPEPFSLDLAGMLADKARTVDEEKKKRLHEAELHLKAKHFNAAILELQAWLSIEEQKSAIKQLSLRISQVQEKRKRQMQKRTAAGVIAAGIVVILVYLLTGPIPDHLNRKKIQTHLERCNTLIAAGDHDGLKEMILAIDQTREKLDSEVELDKTVESILVKEVENLNQRSLAEEKRGDRDAAIENAERIKTLFDGFYLNASGKWISAAVERSRQLKHDKYFELGNSSYLNKNYQDAVEKLSLAYTNMPNEETNKRLAKAKYDRYLELGISFYNDKKYAMALDNFVLANQNANTPEVQKLIDLVRKDATIERLTSDLEKYRKVKDYDNELLTLINLKTVNGQSIAPFYILNEIAYTNESGLPEVSLNSIRFVFVKGGEFKMGCDASDSENFEDALPAHNVMLDDFWVSKTEVTEAQLGAGSGSNYPARVTWKKAAAFASQIGLQFGIKSNLITEAQWEYVARNGGMTLVYPWGNSISCAQANFKDCRMLVRVVGSFPPNKLGIFDIVGNVREWCRDDYDEKYYSEAIAINPVNLSNRDEKVVRGGSYADGANALKVFARYSRAIDVKDDYTGFRLVLEKGWMENK